MLIFYIHFWAGRSISAPVSDATWRHSNNGGLLWKETNSMYPVLA